MRSADVTMYVCMYVCMHVCMHACMHACLHVCMYEGIHVFIHVCICVYIDMYVYVYMYICICTHVCIHICTHVWICVLLMLPGPSHGNCHNTADSRLLSCGIWAVMNEYMHTNTDMRAGCPAPELWPLCHALPLFSSLSLSLSCTALQASSPPAARRC